METIINKLPDDINYMFYIKHKGDKRFSTYNPCKGTMGTGLVFTELYRKEHLLAVCKWIAEDNSGEWIYQLRSGGGKKIYWEHNPMPATPAETPRISTEAVETVNVSAEGEKEVETREIGRKPEGREAKCRLAPAWAAKKALNHGYTLYCFNLYPNGDFSISVENGEGCHILTKDEFRKLCSEPPQSPETPQTTECTTDTLKSRETARERPNRGIGNTRHSALGANGYAMLDDASATLTAMHVPHECSTADAAYR